MARKAMIAMSGGVDSSVAALFNAAARLDMCWCNYETVSK